MQPPSTSTLRTSPATVVVLLVGALAAVLIVLRSAPPSEGLRRPTDDTEVLERVVPRAAARDAGAAADGGEVPR